MSYLLLLLLLTPTLIILLLRLLALVLPTRPAQLASFYAFSITAVCLMLLCALYGVFASIALRCVGYGGLSQWTVARAFKWTMWFATGVTFRVTGSMKSVGGINGTEALQMRPVVFVGNHQTELDVLMLGCMFPKYTSVTAKSSLKYTPFLGWFMTLSHTVFINRADRASSRAAFDTAAQTMRDTRQSVFIFPEGTRSYSLAPTLLPLKKGAFHLAVQAQVPLVPVVCANYAHVLDVKGRKFSPGVVEVSVLPPVLTVGMGSEDVNGLVEKVGKDMLEELGRLDGLRREGVEGGNAGGGEGRGSGRGEARGELRRRA